MSKNEGLTMNQLAEINAQHVTTIATLEAKCAALAAENAGLKQFPDQIVGFIVKLGSSEIGAETKERIEAAAKKIKTPATDSFLAEVRAQGVEMFAEQQRSFIGKPSKNDAASSYSSREAISFAGQLRKGAAQ